MDKIALFSKFDRSKMPVIAACVVAVAVAFAIYVVGIGSNPPGFYVDESGLAYNGYLVATTGAGEYGPKFPLYFQLYPGGFKQFSNPTHIYLLAAVFFVTGPSILMARLLAAASVFAGCLLLGLLANKLSGSRLIGLTIAMTALITPWLFEVGRLVLETFFYPLAVVGFLWALYFAHRKLEWTWINIAALVGSLALLTYSYTIGRLLAGLFALGLVIFIDSKKRALSVLIVWILYGVSLLPFIVFTQNQPGITDRFYLISYIKPGMPKLEIIKAFIPRFFAELNPWDLLYIGDTNARHHVPDSYGSILLGTFMFAVVGVVIILVWRRRDRWWLFVIYGFLASIVPGALTNDHAHTLRMVAYPIFLLLLTVPALEWLFLTPTVVEPEEQKSRKKKRPKEKRFSTLPALAASARYAIVGVLVALTLTQGAYFHYKYYSTGERRGDWFDTGYKTVYDAAVARSERPIYLVDAYWGPMSMHAHWYATLEGRPRTEFQSLAGGSKPSRDSLVLSTEQACTNCEMIRKEGVFLLYRTK